MIVRSVEAIIQMLDAKYIENEDISKVVKGVCIDSRKVVEGNLYIPIKGVNNNGHKFIEQAIANGAAATLWNQDEPNPPHDITVILVDDTTAALQYLAGVYRRQLNMKVVGVTGSNGKTSTKDILAAMCSAKYRTQKTLGNFNNEIGVPLTLLSLSDNCEVAIVEMGMENLNELDFLTRLVKPDVAIISNVGTAHLENLGTMENIAKAKLEITHGLSNQGLFIYNGDSELLVNGVKEKVIPGYIRIKTFGMDEKRDVCISEVRQENETLYFTLEPEHVTFHMDMLGAHQAMNAAAAYMAAKELGLTNEEIQKGLNHIEKTGMRNELVACGTSWILNDAYKSNPQSALAAMDTLESFQQEYKIAVLGDMLELGETSDQIHYNLGKSLAKYHVKEVLTYGEMARYIAQGARDYMSEDVYLCHFETKEELIEYLRPYTEKECMILVKGSRGLQMDEIVDALLEE